MGEREAELGRLLGGVDAKSPRVQVNSLPKVAQDLLTDLYQTLGGVMDPMPPLRPGGWDIVLTDGRVLELDEEQHFNRYRAASLKPVWARALPWCAEYRDQSRRYEFVCKRVASGGRFLSSPVAERMFGESWLHYELEGVDWTRWKQRALYDAAKDIAALHGAIRLARVSVWDNVSGVALGNILAGLAEVNPEELMRLVDERTVG